MMLEFSDLLRVGGFNPSQVKLLRHHNERGRTPFETWLNDRPAFEQWQSCQKQSQRSAFAAPVWASFVSTPSGGTMFVGLYSAELIGAIAPYIEDVLRGGETEGSDYDDYQLDKLEYLSELGGRLFIEWPAGRNWKRRGDGIGYSVHAITAKNAEPPYPGHSKFLEPLSAISTLYLSWQSILNEAKGVYVITCPRDREHYVGKADGQRGFFGRWLAHAANQGDAVGFKKRPNSDYTVGILEVAGSFATSDDINKMEQFWMKKLQSRSIGIN